MNKDTEVRIMLYAKHSWKTFEFFIKNGYKFNFNLNNFEKFSNKIIYVKVHDMPSGENPWLRENFQRNCIQRGIEKLNLTINDIIAISDVDEIWSPTIIKDLYDLLDQYKFLSVDMNYFVFYLNLETVNKKWIGTIFTKFQYFDTYSPQSLRNIKDQVLYIKNSGWHFGYQGGKEVVYQKYLSCIEPFDKTCLPTKENFDSAFDKKIKDGGSFIFSDNLNNDSIKLQKIENKYLPQFLQENLERYSHMFY